MTQTRHSLHGVFPEWLLLADCVLAQCASIGDTFVHIERLGWSSSARRRKFYVKFWAWVSLRLQVSNHFLSVTLHCCICWPNELGRAYLANTRSSGPSLPYMWVHQIEMRGYARRNNFCSTWLLLLVYVLHSWFSILAWVWVMTWIHCTPVAFTFDLGDIVNLTVLPTH